MSYAAQLGLNANYVLPGDYIPSSNAILPNGDLIFNGNGFLGGDFPDFITKVEGLPTKTEILVFVHGAIGSDGNGQLIAHIETLDSGSWRADNLNPNLKYDVICRYAGYKDEIMSNIQPFVM